MTLIMSGVLTGCGLFGLKTGLRSLGERVNEAARDTVGDGHWKHAVLDNVADQAD